MLATRYLSLGLIIFFSLNYNSLVEIKFMPILIQDMDKKICLVINDDIVKDSYLKFTVIYLTILKIICLQFFFFFYIIDNRLFEMNKEKH